MKLSNRKQLLSEAEAELKRIKRLNEAQSVMPTVGTIRKVQYSLEYLDKWLRGEPGYHVKNATSTFQQLEKSIGDIKKFVLSFEKEIKNSKK